MKGTNECDKHVSADLHAMNALTCNQADLVPSSKLASHLHPKLEKTLVGDLGDPRMAACSI